MPFNSWINQTQTPPHLKQLVIDTNRASRLLPLKGLGSMPSLEASRLPRLRGWPGRGELSSEASEGSLWLFLRVRLEEGQVVDSLSMCEYSLENDSNSFLASALLFASSCLSSTAHWTLVSSSFIFWWTSAWIALNGVTKNEFKTKELSNFQNQRSNLDCSLDQRKNSLNKQSTVHNDFAMICRTTIKP